MEQLDFFDVPSPCVGVCSADERGYCKGCMRNRQERFGWQQLSNQEKLNVIKLCRRRYRRRQTEKIKKTTPPEMNPAATLDSEDTQPDLF
ncbi:DUF1289 domain-containing protein [Vibrio salinus]|uniref:DUF1289 domain-containing protein n=1 Tax=Vibrio salinus TaxID=2899784 RepID=UPI001E5EEC24|nr:DUF1289 domain-containing protein [Vibrio salinus]MCE0492636.1 DUF1289 domain-containing protein [Vibrio salinus]